MDSNLDNTVYNLSFIGMVNEQLLTETVKSVDPVDADYDLH